jgi:hypothetical protein
VIESNYGEEIDLMDLVGILIQIVISTVILSPALWISGRLIAGKDKAKFTDALLIVFLGSIINTVVSAFIGNLIATIILLIVWLALIKHFFDCGWIKAFVIAVVAVVIFAIVVAILAILFVIIGIGIIATWI